MYVQNDTYSAAHAFVAYDCWHVFEHVKHMCYGTAIVVIANVCHSVVLVLVLCALGELLTTRSTHYKQKEGGVEGWEWG